MEKLVLDKFSMEAAQAQVTPKALFQLNLFDSHTEVHLAPEMFKAILFGTFTFVFHPGNGGLISWRGTSLKPREKNCNH